MKCYSCGKEKDCSVLETYPYNEDTDGLTQEIPIPPLLTVECQGEENCPDGGWDFRVVVMCHDCWHQLGKNTQGIDMWIGQSCWESLTPKVPFEKLPKVLDLEGDEKWKAELYPQL